MEGPDGERKTKANFYARALTETEREKLDEARAVEGLEEEIATLRVRVATALKDHKDDVRLALYGMNVLVRMVATQYRLSPRSSKDFADHVAAVLNDVADLMVPSDR